MGTVCILWRYGNDRVEQPQGRNRVFSFGSVLLPGDAFVSVSAIKALRCFVLVAHGECRPVFPIGNPALAIRIGFDNQWIVPAPMVNAEVGYSR